jgi:mono/diheme cytochrome c family protein
VSHVARWAALGALVLGGITVATWESGRPDEATVAATPLDGAALFRSKGCASCHRGPDSESPMGLDYPSLAAASSWAGDRRHGMSAEDYLLESIAAPAAFTSPEFSGNVGPGGAMPQLGLTADEIDAIVGYLLADGN